MEGFLCIKVYANAPQALFPVALSFKLRMFRAIVATNNHTKAPEQTGIILYNLITIIKYG